MEVKKQEIQEVEINGEKHIILTLITKEYNSNFISISTTLYKEITSTSCGVFQEDVVPEVKELKERNKFLESEVERIQKAYEKFTKEHPED